MKLLPFFALVGLGVWALAMRRAIASESREELAKAPPSPEPSKPLDPVKTMPNRAPYQTTKVLPPELLDSLRLKSGKRFTRVPLRDAELALDGQTRLWARADYDNGARLLDSVGLRFPTFDELDEIASRPDALILEPCTLVQTASDAREMATVFQTSEGKPGFWARHDACVAAQLESAPSGFAGPVVSIGKHWALGAPPGRSWLHGWYVPRGAQPGGGYSKIIQNRGTTAHNSKQVDYSSTLIGVEK